MSIGHVAASRKRIGFSSIERLPGFGKDFKTVQGAA
jgi:hypothetical protein